MKNLNTRTVLIIFLFMASLGSYLFLKSESSKVVVQKMEPPEKKMEEEQEQSKIFLPDIALIKKAIQITKTLLHPFPEN